MFYALSHGGGSPDLAYVLGVMLGDGHMYWQSSTIPRTGQPSGTWRCELQVIDPEFAEAFAVAMSRTVKRPEHRHPHVMTRPGRNGGKTVHRVLVASRSFGDWFNELRQDQAALTSQACRQPTAFLRGLYDSEGNLSFTGKNRTKPQARIFSQDRPILEVAVACLETLEMSGSISVFRKGGTKVRMPGDHTIVARELLVLRPTPARRFLSEVGSSIPRKSL